MCPTLRPRYSFILRLWHEPDSADMEADWRGVLRPLGHKDFPPEETAFRGLDELTHLLRSILSERELHNQNKKEHRS